ncbi:MAG TPA: energy-coupling factor transporter transmembrane protein EcfT [Anaerolineae bacterium]|nr:energy-coupling factor transporter transmembrane protein EcfT [Anaerolineae bacterium]
MLVAWKYRFRNSFIEKFDPRARWIVSFLILAAVLNFWDIRIVLLFFALALTQFVLTKLTWKETKKAWIFILILVVFIVGINAFIFGRGGPGQILRLDPHYFYRRDIPLGPWTWEFSITAEKLAFGFTQIIRMLTISIMFFVIPWTMDPSKYGVTFSGMGLPYRAAFAMDLAFRFVPTLARDFQTTLDAQRARGFEIDKLDGGIIAMIRKIAPLVIPVTMGSIVAGEDIINAMDLRCFGLEKRTWIDELRYTRRDYLLIAFGLIVLIVALVVRYGFGFGGQIYIPNWLIGLTQ